MASEYHLEFLAQGVDAWNRWRADNPQIQPDLSGADLTKFSLGGEDWTGAELLHARLGVKDVDAVNEPGANLSGAILSGAVLHHADLFHVNLSRAVVTKADLCYANLKLADLSDTNFTRSNLANACFERAGLRDAILSDANLSGARELRSTRGVCRLDRATLLKSGLLPIEFLRRCAAPEELIAEAREAFGIPRGTLTCFISHATSDRPFVDRLHEDLRQNGIKCWYSPSDSRESAKLPRSEMRRIIASAIDVHDRTLVVLSEASLRREWVQLELSLAAGIEPHWHLVNQVVLVRIDRAHEAREFSFSVAGHMIVDFCEWQTTEKYDAALKQLVQKLRGEEPEGDLIYGGRALLNQFWRLSGEVADAGKRVSAQDRRNRRY